jgi:hypothetical protein
LFGVHVQRERAEKADVRANVAEQRASEHAEDATKGKVLASAVKAEALTVGTRKEAPAFGGEAAPELAPVARLATLADQLFPEQH